MEIYSRGYQAFIYREFAGPLHFSHHGIIIEAMVKNIMQQEALLNEYPVAERTAYLKAITALATADRNASEDEEYLLTIIAESSELPAEEIAAIKLTADNRATEAELHRSLDILKNSDLRFSLLTDLMAFAESDQNYSTSEKQQVEAVALYLNIDPQQFFAINQFVTKAAGVKEMPATTAQPNNFLESFGMEKVFSNAGMNFGSITKGLLGMPGPLVLGKSSGPSGGLGSLISMLNGGRGMGNIGGMPGRMFGGK